MAGADVDVVHSDTCRRATAGGDRGAQGAAGVCLPWAVGSSVVRDGRRAAQARRRRPGDLAHRRLPPAARRGRRGHQGGHRPAAQGPRAPILNLLINAAEAMTDDSPRDLHVELRACDPGILAVTIRDSGRGVAPTELEHIFHRYVTSKADGLGMGLSISRSIVEAHRGRIWATRNLDRGLTVRPYVDCDDGVVGRVDTIA